MKDQILDFEGSMPVGYKTIISQGFHSKKQLITLTIWGAGLRLAPQISLDIRKWWKGSHA